MHLAEWEPLKRAVPSKTYELMEAGMHITAVVQGETADIILENCAGIVVEPGRPDLLASAWESLAREPNLLSVGNEPKEWVRKERKENVPAELFATLFGVKEGSSNDKTS